MSKKKIEEAKRRVMAALIEVRERQSASAEEGKLALRQFLGQNKPPAPKPGQLTFTPPTGGGEIPPMTPPAVRGQNVP